MLERYKNVEGLAAAWRLVAARVPGAELHLVGNGTLTELVGALVREGIGVHWDRRLEPPELAAAIDAARALVLPSASEGLPRIVIEAFVRGRAVVGATAGGIPDIVEDGVNGLLVPAGDTAGLAAAIERVLTDGALAARLGAGAAAAASKWTATPEQYAERWRRSSTRRSPRTRSRLLRPPEALSPPGRERGPDPVERGGGEEREHEVPRHPVAGRAREHPGRRRLVEHEDDRERPERRTARRRARRSRAGRAARCRAAPPTGGGCRPRLSCAPSIPTRGFQSI